jgi:hypothetical protein
MVNEEDTVIEDTTPEVLKGKFTSKYHKVLAALDNLYQGVLDEDEAPGLAALCLLTQAALFSSLSGAEFKARALKRDIDFAKAEVFSKLKVQDGKKLTDALVANLVVKDPEVQKLSRELNQAEREAKDLANILALLKEAHITFRSIRKSTGV